MKGVEKVLDDVPATTPRINTLFVATFTYGRGIAGRQVPGQPLPDHGKQEYDTDTLQRRQLHAHPSAVLPRHRRFTDFRAPDFGDYDVLEAVLPAARKRGMKTICWFEDVWRARRAQHRAGAGKAASTGRTPTPCASTIPTTATGCWAWWRTTRAPTRSTASCGARSGRARSPMRWARATAAARATRHVTCFCQFCERKAQRARHRRRRAPAPGFRRSSEFVEHARQASVRWTATTSRSGA